MSNICTETDSQQGHDAEIGTVASGQLGPFCSESACSPSECVCILFIYLFI